MFPIVHYYSNLVTYGKVPPLMALGGLFPDLAAGAGLNRDNAHQMGAAFHRYCLEQAPEALPLALGILSHGVEPHGVDYYADEYWPGCQKGWCFEIGRPWIPQIQAATHLPENLLWWKSHNFAEICYELITIEAQPQIGAALVAATEDTDAVNFASELLHRYTGSEQAKIVDMFQRAPYIFALAEVTPKEQAVRQERAFCRRHNVYDADIPAMVALFTEMKEALRPGYTAYMAESTRLVTKMLQQY